MNSPTVAMMFNAFSIVPGDSIAHVYFVKQDC
jgi:hypothetical protein